MAFASSSSVAFAVQSIATFLPVSEKLNRTNYQSWKAQVTSALRSAQLTKFIDPTVKPPAAFLTPKEKDKKEPPVSNPDYELWVAKDQTILNFILSDHSKEILSQVSSDITVADAWRRLKDCSQHSPALG
jgi:hypothetical protein